jgi:hypothetical protein
MPPATPPGNAERDARFIARADEGATWAQIAREIPSVCPERIRQIVTKARRRAEAKRNGWLSVREQMEFDKKRREDEYRRDR